MAASLLQDHDVPLHRNKDMISPDTVFVREDFEAVHPEIARLILQAHVAVRRWAAANLDAMTQILSRVSGLSPDIARLQLSRTNLTGEAMGSAQLAGILATLPILRASGTVTAGADIDRTATPLVHAPSRRRSASADMAPRRGDGVRSTAADAGDPGFTGHGGDRETAQTVGSTTVSTRDRLRDQCRRRDPAGRAEGRVPAGTRPAEPADPGPAHRAVAGRGPVLHPVAGRLRSVQDHPDRGGSSFRSTST